MSVMQLLERFDDAVNALENIAESLRTLVRIYTERRA